MMRIHLNLHKDNDFAQECTMESPFLLELPEKSLNLQATRVKAARRALKPIK
jgi:hypothetical protein